MTTAFKGLLKKNQPHCWIHLVSGLIMFYFLWSLEGFSAWRYGKGQPESPSATSRTGKPCAAAQEGASSCLPVSCKICIFIAAECCLKYHSIGFSFLFKSPSLIFVLFWFYVLKLYNHSGFYQVTKRKKNLNLRQDVFKAKSLLLTFFCFFTDHRQTWYVEK